MKIDINFEPLNFFLTRIRPLAKELNAEVYLVGGAVRDIVNGNIPQDYDFVVFGYNYEKFAFKYSKKISAFAVLFKDNVRLSLDNVILDISAPRGVNISEDLTLRDFTVNNLAMTLDGELIGDKSDIDNKVIRMVHDKVFKDDPIRVLRAFRLAAKLNYKISGETVDAIDKDKMLLIDSPGERVQNEIQKLCSYPPNRYVFDLLSKHGILKLLFGCDIDSGKLLKLLSGAVLENISDEDKYSLCLSAFLYKESDKDIEKRLRHLCTSNKSIKDTLTIIRGARTFVNRDRNIETELMTAVWQYRAKFNLILLFCLNILDINENFYVELLKLYSKIDENAAQSIDGDDIMRLTSNSGKQIAEKLLDVKVKLAFNILKDRDDAISYLQKGS